MSEPVLDALIAAIDARRLVALVTVTEATGSAAQCVGRRLVVPVDSGLAVAGSLHLPEECLALEAMCVARVHELLAQDSAAPSQLQVVTSEASVTLFVDPQQPPRHLVICGAGHIAVPLAAMARLCDFDVTVIDDRAQYANRERFPTATQVLVGPFQPTLRTLRSRSPFDRRTFLVLVTRGHQHDVDCLLEVMADPLAYVGMIGSRRRIRAVFEMLEREQGLHSDRFAHVFAPVGLDIGAHTPSEIAVAILGEIINIARGGRAQSLRQSRSERVAAKAADPHESMA